MLLVPLVPKVQAERAVLPANKVPPAPKVPKALLAQLDLLALQAWQAQQVQLDQEEPLVPKERMAQPVPPDHKASQAHLVPQAHLAVMGLPVPKDHKEQLVQPVPLLQSLDQPALLAPKVPLVQTVPKVLLGLKDQQAQTARMVKTVQLVHRDQQAHKVLRGRRGRRR